MPLTVACVSCSGALPGVPAARSSSNDWTLTSGERLGHATIAITLDTYSHAIPAMQEEAAVLIADLVFAAK